MTTYKTISRYSKTRTITEAGENRWKLGGEILYCRAGMDDTNAISFVDPDGGPFISRDSALKEYFRDFPDPNVVIDRIESGDDGYVFITKTELQSEEKS